MLLNDYINGQWHKLVIFRKNEAILNLYFPSNKLDKYTVYCGFCFIRTKHEFK